MNWLIDYTDEVSEDLVDWLASWQEADPLVRDAVLQVKEALEIDPFLVGSPEKGNENNRTFFSENLVLHGRCLIFPAEHSVLIHEYKLLLPPNP